MSDKITFRGLVERIGERTGRKPEFSEHFLKELVSIIESGLEERGSVSIAGFGKFELRWMKERKGVHPRTGEEITIPGQNRVVFKPYKSLRDLINRDYAHLEPRLLEKSPKRKKVSAEKITPPAASRPTPPKEEADMSDTGRAGGEPFPYFVAYDEESGDETIDDLLIERPSPRAGTKGKPGAVVSTERPSLTVKDVRKSTTFRWGWLAASILLLLLATVFYYIQLQPNEIGDGPERSAPSLMPPAPSAEYRQEPDVEVVESEEPAYHMIRVASGQTLWDLARDHMGDAYLWPWILHLNNDSIENPNIIRPEMELLIPVPENPGRLSEDERRDVATGYLQLYRLYKQQEAGNAHHFLWAAGAYSPELLDEIEQQVDDRDLRFARSR